MNITYSEPLKPCPFCGSTPRLKDKRDDDNYTYGYRNCTIIRCIGCEARIIEGDELGDGWHNRAVNMWNRRIGEDEAT